LAARLIYDIGNTMGLSISKIKKVGRPRTDAVPIMVRLPAAHVAKLDAWIISKQPESVSRPEAIRRLVEKALK
jgi:hypothetical protein